MNKHKPIQITIPHPCTQNWDEMTPSVNGRHCDHCQRTVIDFTEWSDGALHKFFSKNKEQVCGRFMGSQVDRPIHIPPQPHSRLYRIAIAFGLTIVIANGQQVQARKLPPLVKQGFYRFSDDTTTAKGIDTTGGISGTVLDDKKQPLMNVSVAVYQRDTLKNGTVTDVEGKFVIRPLEPGMYNVVIISMGFDTVIIERVNISHGQSTVYINLSHPLINNKKKQDEYYLGMPSRNPMEINKRTYTREDIYGRH